MRGNRANAGLSILALLAFFAAGCDTLDYRQVQSEFNDAVQLDNELTADPFRAAVGGGLYASVANQLTDEFIEDLDPKLQANAWLLRSISAWRSGDLDNADKWAVRGQGAPGPVSGSRDDVLLYLIRPVVLDAKVIEDWANAGKGFTQADYTGRYAGSYSTAFSELEKARGRIDPRLTPVTTRYYLYFQAWRMVANWRSVITTTQWADTDAGIDARRSARRTAAAGVATALGIEAEQLGDALDILKAKIPGSHPLRAYMEAASK